MTGYSRASPRRLVPSPNQELSPVSDKKNTLSRRSLLKTTGAVAAASALAGVVVPHVHAGASGTIKLALVGCGGRGTGAAENALRTSGPTELVAMADVFRGRLDSSHT